MMADRQDEPWYRQFWPWFLMIPPAAAVIGGFATAFVAGGPPSLVVDDYGQIAMATEARAKRDRNASELALSADLLLGDAGDGEMRPIRIKLEGSRPSQVTLHLIHPTIERLDRSAILDRNGDEYRGVIDRPPGRFYVQIEDVTQTWRLTGELYEHLDRLALISNAHGGVGDK
jgi:hypothetical protein